MQSEIVLNTVQIKDIAAFVSKRDLIVDGKRQVVLVRCLGENSDLTSEIVDMDHKLGTEMYRQRLKYTRVSNLPSMVRFEDGEYYARIYDGWSKEKVLNLQKQNFQKLQGDEPLQEAISCALEEVFAKYRASKPSVTESMLRNIGTKLLFWLDQSMAELLKKWTSKSIIKVVFENIEKEQEYLFALFVTLIGCDVLLIQNKCDVKLSEALDNLSQTFVMGEFGISEIPEYVVYIPAVQIAEVPEELGYVEAEQQAEVEQQAEQQVESRPIRVVIPEHPRRKKANSNTSNTGSTNSASNIEKSFEELALLASSIVMIAVHDNEGEVTGTGSGIMIGRDGYILTNCHVVSRGVVYAVRIEDDDNTYTTAELIKYNQVLDLAIIRIDKQLKPLPIYNGAKKLVRGQKVVAIGSPLGLFNSVSDGIISGFRNIRDVDMIQFTAPTSPGSSGGAVLNMQGEVIGISTAGIDNGQNINLAVGYEDIRIFAKGLYS